MSDTYQAIYDAVRSRISNGDIGAAVRDAMPDISWQVEHVKSAIVAAADEWCAAGREHARPASRMRPVLSADGNQWCMLYGSNLQEGVAGFGDTPEAAATAFDKAWLSAATPAAGRIA